MKKISIAMCIYNGEKYLKEQLDSIINQTYTNIELIIVDDCSFDKSREIVKEYKKKYDFIKLFENDSNLGLVKNFEKSISLCTGEYIALSDQDDIWEYSKLEKLINIIEKENLDLVYCDSLMINENAESLNKKLSENTPDYSLCDNLFLLFNNGIAGHSMLFKNRDLVIPFPNNIDLHDLWITYIFSSSNKIGFLKLPLVKYRIHNQNLTKIGTTKKKKNFLEKRNSKLKSNKNFYKKLENYILYLEKFLPNHQNLRFTTEIYNEYSKYENTWFNLKLFLLLKNNRNRLFLQKNNIGIIKIFKMSLGYKTYKIFPFV